MVDRKQQYQSLVYSKKFRRRAFYLVIICLAAMTLYDVTNLALEYIANPTKADMSMNFNQSMLFPNMTFCMPKRQAWSHYGVDVDSKAQMEKVEKWGPNIENALANLTDKEKFMHEPWPPELVMSAYQAVARLNSLERDSVAHKAMLDIKEFAKTSKMARQRILVKNWLNIINARGVSFAELTRKIGFELLSKSIRLFERVSLNDSDVFHMKPSISWISKELFCFQPMFLDKESFKPIDEQGAFFRLVVTHAPNMLEGKESGECMKVDFHGRPTTMARNMQGKGRVKDGIEEQLCVGHMHELTVGIGKHYKMLENDDPTTACRLYDDEESESEFDCRSRCRMDMIRQMCKCTPLTLRYLSDDKSVEQYPLCDYEKCDFPDNQNFTDKLCAEKCYPHCVQIRFNLDLDQLGRSKNPAITTVTLLWGAFEYLKLEQCYEWSLWTFIAAVGGSIGMWLGLSILSLIQLVTFVTERTAQRVTVKKKVTDRDGGPYSPPPQYSQHPQYPHGGGTVDDSKSSRDRKTPSLNPFGGPVAVNIFETPFPSGENNVGAPPTSQQRPMTTTPADPNERQ